MLENVSARSGADGLKGHHQGPGASNGPHAKKPQLPLEASLTLEHGGVR